MPTPLKPPELRQRRNRTSTEATIDGTAAPPKRPALPRRVDERGKPVAGGWHPMARRWWDTIWASPMASQWLPADVEALVMVLPLVDSYWRAPDPKTLAEIRMQTMRFGLAPLDRMRLHWTVQSGPPKRTPQARPSPPPERRLDPRGVLRMPDPRQRAG